MPYNESVTPRQLRAIYENGVFRPLEAISLPESQTVSITISPDTPSTHPQLDTRLLEQARAETAALEHIPTLEEVQAALATIPGNMSEDVIAERGEY